MLRVLAVWWGVGRAELNEDKKKKKQKLKKEKSQPDDVPVQLESVSNRTMVQQMASETLSPTASVRRGTTSRERVTKELVFCS